MSYSTTSFRGQTEPNNNQRFVYPVYRIYRRVINAEIHKTISQKTNTTLYFPPDEDTIIIEGQSESSISQAKQFIDDALYDKIGVNFFLSVRVNRPTIVAKVQEFHNNVIQNHSEFMKFLTPIDTLHITFFVMGLYSDVMVKKAIAVLNSSEILLQEHFSEYPFLMQVKDIDTFSGGRVVFMSLADNEHTNRIINFSKILYQHFEKEQLTPEKYNFHPHITLMKLRFDKRFKANIIPAEVFLPYKTTYFGQQYGVTIDLLQMAPKPKGGYYKCHHKINIPRNRNTNQNNNHQMSVKGKEHVIDN